MTKAQTIEQARQPKIWDEEYDRRIDTLLEYRPELLNRYTRDQIELIYDCYRGSVEEGHAIESLEDYIRYRGDHIIVEMVGETVKEH